MDLTVSRSIAALTRQRLSTYYLRSPFRSHYFVAPSLLLLTDFFLMGAILVKNWNRLPGWTIFLLGLTLIALIMDWVRVYRTHSTVQHYLRTAQIENLEPGSPLETALYVAASMTYHGSILTYASVGFCLAALGELFIRY